MKIAILGTSPSSRNLAPFADPSWIIWGTGPGNLNPDSKMPRCDAFFEIHPLDSVVNEPTYAPYVMALREIPKVYTQDTHPLLPNAVVYPLAEMVEKYGDHFFTSSFSYMIALAIKELLASPDKEKVVGFWGVDMSATEEYGLQRPGGHHFFYKAREAGITVVLPPESDMLNSPGLYGWKENSGWYRKQIARQKEYQHAVGVAMTEARIANEKIMRLQGVLDDIQWNLNTYAHMAWTAHVANLGAKIAPLPPAPPAEATTITATVTAPFNIGAMTFEDVPPKRQRGRKPRPKQENSNGTQHVEPS